MPNVFDELKSRGYIQQTSDEAGVQKLLSEKNVTFYVGFDSTADSLHVGHLLPLMAMSHFQKAGYRPICLIGGGTTMIGDPSEKAETRKMMTLEEIKSNSEKLLPHYKHFLSFSENKGLFLNNTDWLTKLNYIEFLRDIGVYFKVNEMIKARGYELRFARNEGLSFIEFNYQLLQAYDFLHLFREYGCKLQMGGDDQWSNILAGVDLIKKAEKHQVFALTWPLLTTASGGKMGKTESGAVWLDPKKTSPYEFYQYWINCHDRDVEKFLKLFTFLPLSEIEKICSVSGEKLREAKEILAFEATKITHSESEAKKARDASRRLFSSGNSDSADLPSTRISKSGISSMTLLDLLAKSGLSTSKTEARKLVLAGGVYVNGDQIKSDTKAPDLVKDGVIIIRKGKKTYHRIIVE